MTKTKRFLQMSLVGSRLGDLTDKWRAGPNDRLIRDLFSALCIAEPIGRFDVIALQEVQSNLRALRRIIQRLFPRYGFLLTDANNGDLGGGERLAFRYDGRLGTEGISRVDHSLGERH